MDELKSLEEQNIAHNFYSKEEFEEDWYDKSTFLEWDESYGDEYRKHLYGFIFDINSKGDFSNPMFKFFDKCLGDEYKKRMFYVDGGMLKHNPLIGIYNSIKNQLIGIGLGRKNDVFIVSNDGSINKDNIDELFCELDHAEVVETLIRRLSTWGVAQLTISGYYGDVDEDDAFEAEGDLDSNVSIIRRDYLPSFPEDPTDISPCDF
jgi:hypothetical protein